MKFRNGFVSNSSSSSFCIFGISVPNYLYHDLPEEIKDDWELEDKTGLAQIGPDMETGDYFIGVHPNLMKEDETRGEFTKRIGELIRQNFGEEIDLTTIGFHNGEYSC